MMYWLNTFLLPMLCCPFVLGLLFNSCCCQGCTFVGPLAFSSGSTTDWFAEVSGTATVTGGVLSTSSSGAAFISLTDNPTPDANTKVNCTVNIGTSTDTARIILDYVDSNNYWFVEVRAGAGAYLRIYQRSGGTNTQIRTVGITLSAGVSFGFCGNITNGGLITVRVGLQTLQHLATFSSASWGIGTGTNAGTVTFDDVEAAITSTECVSCGAECPFECDEGTVPVEIKVVASGLTNGTSGCSDCGSLDGTYYVQVLSNPGSQCRWYPSGNPSLYTISACSTLWKWLVFSDGVPTKLWVTAASSTTASRVNFVSSFNLPIDCRTLSNTSIPYFSITGTDCAGTSATVEVTAIVL